MLLGGEHDVEDFERQDQKVRSPEFAAILVDEATLVDLATKSLAGDKEAKEQLDPLVKALIARIESFELSEEDDFDVNEHAIAAGMLLRLKEADSTPCLEPFKEVGLLLDLPPIGDVVEANGSRYIPKLYDSTDSGVAYGSTFTGAEYGERVEKALAELAEDRVVTLFNGVQVVKDKLGLHKIIPRQLNKARSEEELIELLDKQNGMNLRCDAWRKFTERHPEVLVEAFDQVLNYFSSVKVEDIQGLVEVKAQLEEVLATVNKRIKEGKTDDTTK
jgi:hypothetical protein